MLATRQLPTYYYVPHHSPNPDEQLGMTAPSLISEMVQLTLIFRGTTVIDVEGVGMGFRLVCGRLR